MLDEYSTTSSSKINYLISSKKPITIASILNDFEQKLNPLPYKLDQYKQFVDKTEQVIENF